MSYKHTIQAGIEGLHEIEQLLHEFPQKGNIPNIDLDLILQKIRSLYEILLLLKQHQSDSAFNQSPGRVTSKLTEDDRSAHQDKEGDKDDQASGLSDDKHADEAKILSDQFGNRSSLYDSIHESVLQKGSESIGQTKPVASIVSAIGINDRYNFIRELFNNDINGFENTIRILDEAANFNEAYNYMIQNFDWDMDSETVQLLLDIIRKKYIKGKHE